MYNLVYKEIAVAGVARLVDNLLHYDNAVSEIPLPVASETTLEIVICCLELEQNMKFSIQIIFYLLTRLVVTQI